MKTKAVERADMFAVAVLFHLLHSSISNRPVNTGLKQTKRTIKLDYQPTEM